MTEHWFTSWDGERLFYRAWIPSQPCGRAVVLFHRGHEHSGRLEDTVRGLGSDFCCFAWDARGHGRSPGERGWAESFAAVVRDAECFVQHISREHGIPMENIAILAHSIGAVIAATWVHDYAPPIRAMVLACPAFRVKLYIPFAIPFLRLQTKVQKKAFVKSYVRPGMLTHDRQEAESYARDPLISRAVSVKLLVEMRDAARRVVDDAAAIRTPALVLASGSDYVVRLGPQREFFRRLGSEFKEMREYPGFYHSLLHEQDRARPIADAREFLLRAFECPVVSDAAPQNQQRYGELTARPSPLAAVFWGAQRMFLKSIGRLSAGIRAGWRSGFDSGESLDYVYRNRAEGVTPLGRMIDRFYLESPGWRGIRERKRNLELLLADAIDRARRDGLPVRIFDPAAGGGRYILETMRRVNGGPMSATLRDWSASNVEAAGRLARELEVRDVTVMRGDAFDRRSVAAVAPRPGIAVVSGLYELVPENAQVSQSLLGLSEALADGGYLIYTNQLWHPQLEMIARVLDNREGKRWVMRCRPQAEMDALARAAGFEKIDMRIDADGIFSVSLARRAGKAESC